MDAVCIQCRIGLQKLLSFNFPKRAKRANFFNFFNFHKTQQPRLLLTYKMFFKMVNFHFACATPQQPQQAFSREIVC